MSDHALARLPLRNGYEPVPEFVDFIVAAIQSEATVVVDLSRYAHDEYIEVHLMPTDRTEEP